MTTDHGELEPDLDLKDTRPYAHGGHLRCLVVIPAIPFTALPGLPSGDGRIRLKTTEFLRFSCWGSCLSFAFFQGLWLAAAHCRCERGGVGSHPHFRCLRGCSLATRVWKSGFAPAAVVAAAAHSSFLSTTNPRPPAPSPLFCLPSLSERGTFCCCCSPAS